MPYFCNGIFIYNTNSMKRFLTLLALAYAVIGVSAQSLQLNSKDYLE